MKKISDIFPQKLLADPSQAGIMAALDDQFDTFEGVLDDIIGIMDISNQTDVRILDTLAYCFGLQLYDQGSDLATKKAILAKAVELRRRIGTIYSIREAVKMISDPAKFDWDNYPLEITESPGARYDGTYNFDGTMDFDSIFHWARFSVIVKYLTALSAAEEALIEKAILAYKPLRCQLIDLTYEQAIAKCLYYELGDYTQIQNAAYNLTGDMSLIMEVYPTVLTNVAYWTIAVTAGAAQIPFAIRYTSTGTQLQWGQGTSAGGYDFLNTGLTPSINNLYRVIVTRTGGTGSNNLVFNLNGVDATLSTTKSITSSTPYLCIMDGVITTLNSNAGYVKHLSLYNRVLSGAEKTAALAGNYPDPSTSVGYWDTESYTGLETSVDDQSPTSQDITWVGASWATCPA